MSLKRSHQAKSSWNQFVLFSFFYCIFIYILKLGFCCFSIYKIYLLIYTWHWSIFFSPCAAEYYCFCYCFVLVLGWAAPVLPLLSGRLTTFSGLWRDELAFWVTSCSILFLIATSRPCKETNIILRVFKIFLKVILKGNFLLFSVSVVEQLVPSLGQ